MIFVCIGFVYKSLVNGVGKRKSVVMAIIGREKGGNFGSSHRRIEKIMALEEMLHA
jgi:hypothetical protein